MPALKRRLGIRQYEEQTVNQSLTQQRRAGVEAILARIATDPSSRQQLQSDPIRAFQPADNAAELDPAEVVGYCKITCAYSCKITRVTR